MGFGNCFAACGELPLDNFLYESSTFGGIAGGSSGAPLWTGDGIVVGQLLGLCGPNPGDNCLSSNSTVDGRFSVSFDLDSASDRPRLLLALEMFALGEM